MPPQTLSNLFWVEAALTVVDSAMMLDGAHRRYVVHRLSTSALACAAKSCHDIPDCAAHDAADRRRRLARARRNSRQLLANQINTHSQGRGFVRDSVRCLSGQLAVQMI